MSGVLLCILSIQMGLLGIVVSSASRELKRIRELMEAAKHGKAVEVLVTQNEFGNVYIEIPIEFIKDVLPK